MLAPVIVWRETSLYAGDQWDRSEARNVKVRDGVSPALISECIQEIDRICGPCEPRLAAEKLAELRVLTVHRARDGLDVELMATAYTGRLAKYPPDVVVKACDAWADREEFWPSWAELKAECDKRMHGRLAIKRALTEA